MQNVVFDDRHPTFTYRGQWNAAQGFHREWEQSIHVTSQSGATVSFGFQGSLLKIYGTVPTGSGQVLVDISIDGAAPTRITRTAGSEPVYNDIFLQVGGMADFVTHTVVITNRGGPGNALLHFDRVDVESSAQRPTIESYTPPLPPTTSRSPQPTPTVTTHTIVTLDTSTQVGTSSSSAISSSTSTGTTTTLTSSASSTSSTDPVAITSTVKQLITVPVPTTSQTTTIPDSTDTHGRSAPLASILGGALGGLLLIGLLFLATFVWLRRRKTRQHTQLLDTEGNPRPHEGKSSLRHILTSNSKPTTRPTPYDLNLGRSNSSGSSVHGNTADSSLGHNTVSEKSARLYTSQWRGTEHVVSPRSPDVTEAFSPITAPSPESTLGRAMMSPQSTILGPGTPALPISSENPFDNRNGLVSPVNESTAPLNSETIAYYRATVDFSMQQEAGPSTRTDSMFYGSVADSTFLPPPAYVAREE